MPAPLISKDEVLARLTRAFRHGGFAGTTLKDLCAATGLVKASLYHYFPGGKEEMALAVMQYVGDRFAREVLGPLQGPGTVRSRLEAMATGLLNFYDQGREGCLLDVFGIGDARDQLFAQRIGGAHKRFETLLSEALEEAGVARGVARRRAEDGIIRIQGALVVARGKRDPKVFQRVIRELPSTLLT